MIHEKTTNTKTKAKQFVTLIVILTVLLSVSITLAINYKILKTNSEISTITRTILNVILGILLIIPCSEIVTQIVQYILSKTVKPKLIPKMDYQTGIPKEQATMVVIPTIVKTKEKVKELMKKLEIYYIANKSENLYFTLLGDCSESNKEEEEFDKEVIEEGKKQIEKLNKKYSQEHELPIFNFIYRKRIWNEKEESYLGWERKRGMLNQLNEYLLKNINNPFLYNSIEEIPQIKYIITLDADTDLVLNTAQELIGAMSHILNKPIIDKQKNIVVEGYGIMQPRVGINLDVSLKTTFTKIFAGAGGIDNYTNAISDIYQDNFKEGIFTGKGIYDLKVFSEVLKNEIPENTVLSHDLLEGCYLRCGLASDIMLMDGYPTKYNSFMNRLSRWIRGDWQITKWLKNSKLNLLSKYKILDNLRRSILEISIIIAAIYTIIIGNIYQISVKGLIILLSLTMMISQILELLNRCICKKEGEQKQRTFTPQISGIKGIIFRAIITLGCLPYKAYISLKSIIKTIYRKTISKKHLLEWVTSEEAERQSKTDIISYYKQMYINWILGAIVIILNIKNICSVLLGILWILIPFIMCEISKESKKKTPIETLNEENKNFRIFGPDESMSNRLYKVFEEQNRDWNAEMLDTDDCLARNGRIMDSMLSEHMCEGWLEGYLLTGRHGFFASYEAFIRIVDSMAAQHAKWLKVCNQLSWRQPIASLNFILTSNVWQQDHNGFTHQDPGFLDHIANKKADVVRMYLPPDTNCLLSCFDHCIKSKNYVNAIVASKHPSCQWLSMEQAVKHCTQGIGIWDWASNDCGEEPDLVMACCGDTPTLETMAAVTILRDEMPELKIRVVNVVDLFKMESDHKHPHGLSDAEYDAIFTKDKPVIFAFHGYPTLIHELTYERNNHNISVHGYQEEGTITTPFDMRVQNQIDRFNLVKDAIMHLPQLGNRGSFLIQKMNDKLVAHKQYIAEYGQDMEEIRNWEWHK